LAGGKPGQGGKLPKNEVFANFIKKLEIFLELKRIRLSEVF
jgi:hypothetical protein